MLNCIYHPIDGMQVVSNEEKDRLLALGVWFDSPAKAKAYKDKVEKEIKEEPKAKKSKAKLEE